jgi:hypothetical protein
MTPQKLIANARKAYEENRLVAQKPGLNRSDCHQLLSLDQKHCCGVGASLRKSQYKKFGDSVGLPNTPLDTETYGHLMRTHDSWARDRLTFGTTPEALIQRENDFRAVIELEPLP